MMPWPCSLPAVGVSQPTHQVVALAVNSGLVTYPIGYTRVWEAEGITLWRPQPQPGYRPLGCLATTDDAPPGAKAVVCVHEHAVVEAQLGECLLCASSGSLWAVQNDVGTFEASVPGSHLPEVGCLRGAERLSHARAVPGLASVALQEQMCVPPIAVHILAMTEHLIPSRG
jgi:hypothetical protein